VNEKKKEGGEAGRTKKTTLGKRIASTILSVSGGTRKWIIGIFLRLSLVVVVVVVVRMVKY
jgi:hypothetical protein